MNYTNDFVREWNERFSEAEPAHIVNEVLRWSERPVITTNFRPYEVAILHLLSQVSPELPVIWCDTGYNTPETYRHADEIIQRLQLRVHMYTPRKTAAYRNAQLGGIPSIEDPIHAEFTEEVKLEPFRRAMEEFRPDTWFTNLRKGQTALRDRLGILSLSKEGVLKVSPFYFFSDSDLDGYLQTHGLPNEHRYFDPTKVDAHRECGLHT